MAASGSAIRRLWMLDLVQFFSPRDVQRFLRRAQFRPTQVFVDHDELGAKIIFVTDGSGDIFHVEMAPIR